MEMFIQLKNYVESTSNFSCSYLLLFVKIEFKQSIGIVVSKPLVIV